MRILVLGANGMIGSTMLRVLTEKSGWEVSGTVRSKESCARLPIGLAEQVITGIDLANNDILPRLFRLTRPTVVVNCAGVTKHLPAGNEPLEAITMNSLLPHRLTELCSVAGARLIHVSTDCVFSGSKGRYREMDPADAQDVYGKTKYLGEVTAPGTITLRTSTIGHELGTQFGLLEWFLAQSRCKGYCRAIFSGLPTVEFARVVRDLVIPDFSLEGLYHVGSEAIDKDALLKLIAKVYRKQVEIEPDDKVVIDRSLDSKRFTDATGYRAPGWPEMIEIMHQDQV